MRRWLNINTVEWRRLLRRAFLPDRRCKRPLLAAHHLAWDEDEEALILQGMTGNGRWRPELVPVGERPHQPWDRRSPDAVVVAVEVETFSAESARSCAGTS